MKIVKYWNFNDCSVDNFKVRKWVIHQLSTVVHNSANGCARVKICPHK